jgi:hypothetical protein
MSARENKHPRLWLAAKVAAGAAAFYIVTVGLALAISGHIEIGHLPWLRSETTLDALDAYVTPAGYLSRVPGIAWLFQFSESFWRRVTGAPVRVNYGTRLERVLISDTPKDVMETFRRDCLAMIGAFLSSLAGKTEVTIRSDEGTVFTGIGWLGFRRRFRTSAARNLKIETQTVNSNNGNRSRRTNIIMELSEGKPIKFGSGLNEERRTFLAAAMRKSLPALNR